MKRSTALCLAAALVVVVGAAVPTVMNALERSEFQTSVEGHIYTANAKCQLVRIKPNETIGYIEGYGEGNTEASARSSALKDVDSRVPEGHYKRHCSYSGIGRRGGGGRF
ncbi:hypothetical protein EDF22_0351 [Rathayibacter sp. PhB127]|uniref:hypothetical protein n=1 Tax=Rathayibacter sp. PhB127 TaxID=2485176 RepID=UPI000FBFAA78|nr:hypothetical protein [Rathayibacter sp. PhB127]ROS28626.1 hypothetical protein EDF22_0351 [Rathayibacter sp. PhB127]